MLLKSSVFPSSSSNHELYLDKLKARIDIVREGLVTNPLDVDLECTIKELRTEVTLLIFDRNWINPLPISNWLVVVNFILSFNEVSAAARKNNRSLNFTAQRSVFLILGYVFNHPQYRELSDKWQSPEKEGVFDVIQMMFSEAERQNYDPLLFGDLYAEGEWVSDVMSFTNFTLRYSPNQEGLNSALSLWESFVLYSAKDKPGRIPKLFENLKKNATSNLYGHYIMPIMYPETEEFKSWQKMFKDIQPLRISTLKSYEDAFNVLHGKDVVGDWAKFNGAFGERAPFLADTLPKIEKIWFECIQGSVFDSIAYMYGVCAFYDLWKELKECWYLSQPEDADANYCDHQFFSRNREAFSSWISDHIVLIDRTINERHDLKVHMATACTVLIGDMLNKSEEPFFRFDSIVKSEKLQRFISLLQSKSEIINRESVRSAFGWDHDEALSIKKKVDVFLASELDKCMLSIADSLKNCIPNLTLNLVDNNLNKGDRELVYEAWNQTNQNFWKFFSGVPAVKVIFSRNILADIIQIPFKSCESYYFCERSGKRIHGLDFGGHNVAANLNHRIAQNLEDLAQSPVLNIARDSTCFVSVDDWNDNGWNRLKEKYGFDFKLYNPIKVYGKQSFIAEKDCVELVLTEWANMPWSGGDHPVVVNGFTEFSEFTNGVSALYYQFRLLNPTGIYLL